MSGEDRYRDCLEASSDWFWEMGPDLRFQWLSEGYQRNLGDDPAGVIGKARWEIAGENTESDKWRAHRKALEARRPFRNFRYIVHAPNGDITWRNISGVPFFDANGIFLGYRGTSSDITKIVQAEEALQDSYEELERRVEERTAELQLVNRMLRLEMADREQVEQALRAREAQLTQAQAMTKIGVFIWDDLADRPIYYSQELAEIFGMSVQEMLEMDATHEGALSFVLPEDRSAYDAAIKQATKEIIPYQVTFRSRGKDGRLRYWRESGRPETDDAGRLVRTFGTIQDITDIKQTEEALTESERRYRELFEESPLPILEENWQLVRAMMDELSEMGVKDFPKHFREHPDVLGELYEAADRFGVTEAAVRLYRAKSKEELEAAMTADTADPDELTGYAAMVSAFYAGAASYEYEADEIACDGTPITTRIRAVIPPNSQDDWSRILVTMEDITDRKRAEATVRTRDAWLRAILENAPLQIAIKDPQGHIMAISRNVAESEGLTADDFIGRTVADFLPEEFASIYMEADRRVIETGQPIQQETVEERNGVKQHFLNAKFPLTNDDGETIGIFSLTSDITQMKEMQEQLHQAQKMEAVGQLTGGIAHDFNNLLAIVLGNTELLRLDVDDRAYELLDPVIRAGKRGAELTQRLLAFSRRQPLQPKNIDIKATIRGLAGLMERTLGESIRVSFEFSAQLWPAMADPGQVENAILNLAINARDALPLGGSVTIAGRNTTLDEAYAIQNPEAKPGQYIAISVSDSGKGMSPEVLEHALEPFFTTKGVGQGSGLGLPMVYGFTKQSGGHLTITSEEGQGTTVTLYLPRAECSAPRESKDNGAAAAPGRGELVLVVEDNADVRALTVKMLDSTGYKVIDAPDAASGLAILDSGAAVDLLLSDVVLPGGISGPELVRQAQTRNAALKILFMSGYPGEANSQQCQLLEPEAELLNKPFDKAELAQRLRAILDR